MTKKMETYSQGLGFTAFGFVRRCGGFTDVGSLGLRISDSEFRV